MVFYIKHGIFAGVILRERSVDRLLVRRIDESFLEQLANESSLREVRETVVLEGSQENPTVRKALSPTRQKLPEYESFLESVISETLRLWHEVDSSSSIKGTSK